MNIAAFQAVDLGFIPGQCALVFDTVLRGAAGTPVGVADIQKDPDRLEKWISRNLYRFNSERTEKSCTRGAATPIKDMGNLVNTNLNASQLWAI